VDWDVPLILWFKLFSFGILSEQS